MGVVIRSFLREYLNLFDLEADIYETLIKNGPTTVSSLAFLFNKSTEEIESSIKKLKSAGLVFKIEGDPLVVVALPPYKFVSEKITVLISNLKELKETIPRNIKSKKEDFIKYIEESILMFKSLSEALRKTIEPIEVRIKDGTKELLNSIRNIIDSLNNQVKFIDSQINIIPQVISEGIQDLESLIQQFSIDIGEMVKNALNNYRANILKGTKEIFDQMQQAITILNSEKEKIRLRLDSLTRNLSRFQEDVENLWKEVPEKITESSQKISTLIQQLRNIMAENMVSTIDELKARFFAEFKKIRENAIKEVNMTYDELSSGLEEFVSQIKKKLEGVLETENLDQMEDYKSKLKEKIIKLLEDHEIKDFGLVQKIYDLTLESSLEIFREHLSKLEKNRKKSLDSMVEDLNLLVEFVKNVSRGSAEKLDEKLNEMVEQTSKILDHLIDRTISEANVKIDKITSDFNKKFESFREKVNMELRRSTIILKEANNFLSSELTNIFSELSEISIALKDLVLEPEDKKGSKVWQMIEETSLLVADKIKENLDDYENSLKNKFDSFLNNLLSFKESFIKQISAKIESELHRIPEIEENANKIPADFKDMHEKFDAYYEDVESFILKFQKDIEDNLDSLIETVGNGINKVLDIELMSSQIDQLWNDFIDLNRSRPWHTWLLFGEDLIKNYSVDMIERSKKSARLVVPEMDPETSKIIFKTKNSSSLVEIVTTRPSDITLKEIRKRINFVVRISETVPIFGVVRDDSELLLAPKPEENETPVAIISRARSVIDMFKRGILPLVRAGELKEKSEET